MALDVQESQYTTKDVYLNVFDSHIKYNSDMQWWEAYFDGKIVATQHWDTQANVYTRIRIRGNSYEYLQPSYT